MTRALIFAALAMAFGAVVFESTIGVFNTDGPS